MLEIRVSVVLYGPVMNGSSMNPKPVPAWLNSAAWASTPRAHVRTTYSYGPPSPLEPISRPALDHRDDPLTVIDKPHKEVVTPQEEIDVPVSAAEPEPTQVYFLIVNSHIEDDSVLHFDLI